jgi:hypothetical protein
MKRSEYNFRMLALRRLRDSGSKLNPDDPVLAASLRVARALLGKYPRKTGTDRIGRDCDLARWALKELVTDPPMNTAPAAPIPPTPEPYNVTAGIPRQGQKQTSEVTPEEARRNYADTEEAFDATNTYFKEFGDLPADDFDLKAYYRAKSRPSAGTRVRN